MTEGPVRTCSINSGNAEAGQRGEQIQEGSGEEMFQENI